MDNRLFRFYDPDSGMWLGPEGEPTDQKAKAVLCTWATYKAWGESRGFEAVEIGPDEYMKRAGAEYLPGFGE